MVSIAPLQSCWGRIRRLRVETLSTLLRQQPRGRCGLRDIHTDLRTGRWLLPDSCRCFVWHQFRNLAFVHREQHAP